LPAGAEAWYRRSDKSVVCQACVGQGEPAGPGIAGASAQAEHDRRRASREAKTRSQHPHIGGLMLSLRDAPASERAWQTGAEGERRLAADLEKRLSDTPVMFLHDRRIPGTRANLDHLVVAPSGVFVIDTKRYVGRIERRVDGGLLTPRRERLFIDGRDKTNLVTAAIKQRDVVSDALVGLQGSDLSVYPMLCFVDGDFPWLGAPIVDGVPALSPKAAAQRIRHPGHLAPSHIDGVTRHLAAQFPAAAPSAGQSAA
jgi:hypothetical protein